MNRLLVHAILAVAALRVGMAQTGAPIPIPCPANSPCISIQAVMNDNTHGSITITVNKSQIEALILDAAQTNINASGTLPGFLTQQLDLGNIRYLNGRIILHQVAIGGAAPPHPIPHPPHPGPHPPHPIPHPPIDCGHPGHPPCPSTRTSPSANPVGKVAVSLIDEYQKEHDSWHPFPLPGHWNNDGWPTVGNFTVFGDATFGVDAPLPMPAQHVAITFPEDHATGSITLQAIQGPFTFSLGGKTSTFSFAIVDQTTAAQYGLADLSVSGIVIDSIDASQVVVTGVIGPAPGHN